MPWPLPHSTRAEGLGLEAQGGRVVHVILKNCTSLLGAERSLPSFQRMHVEISIKHRAPQLSTGQPKLQSQAMLVTL